MGVVPSLMGNVCVYVCMYVVDSPKRQGEAMNMSSRCIDLRTNPTGTAPKTWCEEILFKKWA